MNEPRISKAMAHMADDLILGAAEYQPKKTLWRSLPGWAGAACLALVLVGALGLYSLWGGHHKAASQLTVNKADSVSKADMDVRISVYDGLSAEERAGAEAEFERIVGISYDGFAAKIPDTLEITSFYSVDTPVSGSENEYAPHDFVFLCRVKEGSEGSPGGEVKLAVSSLGPVCRDLFVGVQNPVSSAINGVEVTVCGFEGSYLTYFSLGGRFYDVETKNYSLEELEKLLVSVTADPTE